MRRGGHGAIMFVPHETRRFLEVFHAGAGTTWRPECLDLKMTA